MTQEQDNPQPDNLPSNSAQGVPGRHHRRSAPAPRPRRRTWVIGAAVVTVLALASGGVLLLTGGEEDTAAASCTGDRTVLQVVVAPELAPAVTEVARAASAPGGQPCWGADVVSADPATALEDFTRSPASLPAVWLPDSSAWTRPAVAGSLVLTGDAPSIAHSPVVVATAPQGAAQVAPNGSAIDLRAVVLDPAGPALALGLPDLKRSAAALALVQALDGATAGDPAGRLELARVLRAARRDLPAPPQEALGVAAREGSLAVPVSEQAVWAYLEGTPEAPVTALYLPAGTPVLDYPYVVLAQDAATQAAAQRLLDALGGTQARALLAGLGFRDSGGRPGEALTQELGVAPEAITQPAADIARGADAAVQAYEALTRESRVLAVVDVSGSMRRPVPEAGGVTRIELVRMAAGEGLNVYPDGAHIGLWEFATDLAPGQDYRELVPVGPLTDRGDGQTGRQVLARAMAAVEATDGDTALYDSTLAAVRSLRASFDPERANVVVMLSDGRNEDANGISLEELLSALREENDPLTPVPVVTIAYGPETDTEAMASISEATGGILYRSPDPLRIGEVFLDAIARRPCLPDC